MKFSIYFYLFNATLRDFDAESCVENFCNFADEVVCATIKSQDNTRERLTKLEAKFKNFRVIDSDIPIKDNNRFDGQLKTLAMKNCKNLVKVIADADERFPLSQKLIWEKLADDLMKMPFDGFLVPVIDLWGSKDMIRSGSAIGQKFRIHKNTIIERGVPRFAEYGGFFDTSRSDSTEPLVYGGLLGEFQSVANPMQLNALFARTLAGYPYVVHYGSLDLQRRAKIGKEFWKEHWEKRSNKPENVATDIKELEEFTIAHNLSLE